LDALFFAATGAFLSVFLAGVFLAVLLFAVFFFAAFFRPPFGLITCKSKAI